MNLMSVHLSTIEVLPYFSSKEQHFKKIHSLGNSLNSTRQDIKEVSREHFKAMWLARNSTSAEFRRVWTAVNQKPIRVETCNARAQRLNIRFAKYHIWKHKEFVRECFIHVMTHAT